MSVHPLVSRIVEDYIDTVDTEAPGLLSGLYLTGSAALGDFHPHTSDIDFVGVTDTRPDAVAIAALGRAHTQLRDRWPLPHFDGSYVTWDDLANDPARAGQGPRSHEGRFYARGAGPSGDPVTWHTIADYGVACRGPSELKIWTNSEMLACWTINNLNTYWRRLLGRASRSLSSWGLATYSPCGVVWIVLGITRLHYTLATGDICSKELAGCYALQTFPEEWRRIVDESLRIRRADYARPNVASALAEVSGYLRYPQEGGSLYRTPIARRRDVLAFGNMVITDAHRRYGCQTG